MELDDGVIFFILSSILLAVLAGTTILVATKRAKHMMEQSLRNAPQGAVGGEDSIVVLESSQAILIPIVSSISLLALFYFTSILMFVVTLWFIFCSTICSAFTIQPVFGKLFSALGLSANLNVPLYSKYFGKVTESHLAAFIFACSATLYWLMFGSLIIHNWLGLSVCIAFISLFQMPSLKITLATLVLLFSSDIFWVFFSERIFGSNVMLKVAEKQSQNPLKMGAEALHFAPKFVELIDLPTKLIIKNLQKGRNDVAMLGLGDIVIPGLFVATTAFFDLSLRKKKGGQKEGESRRSFLSSYFSCCIFFYMFSILLAFYMVSAYKHAQPALLYIVPLTTLPVLLKAKVEGFFPDLWNLTPKKYVSLQEKDLL